MSTMSDVSDTLNEINEMICGAIIELSNSPVQSRSQLLPEVQRILSGMEFVVQIVSSSSTSSSSTEECSDTNLSLSWDDEGINERKCKTITSPKPSHFLTDTSNDSLSISSDDRDNLIVVHAVRILSRHIRKIRINKSTSFTHSLVAGEIRYTLTKWK